MPVRRFAAFVVLLVALVVPLSLAHPRPAGAVPAVALSLRCTSNPESVRVTNTTSATIVVKTITSIYQPWSNEPFSVYRRLGAGRSLTFQSGAAASVNVLTHQFIYSDAAGGTEGVAVRTSIGVFSKRCAPSGGSGSGSSGGGSSCDPNYTGACIPPYPPDLDCGQISARNFRSIGSDPHGLDRDHDGVACAA